MLQTKGATRQDWDKMPEKPATKAPRRSPAPAELRSMLGANLRQLSQRAPSISALCRDLGINRTQYNRYLAGESFPRPDVLHRICSYFQVDARILLQPVQEITNNEAGILNDPAIAAYLGGALRSVSEEEFPSGFYRFARRSFLDEDMFVRGLIYVFRSGKGTFLKGFEAKDAMRQQGLPTDPATREFRGAVMPQEDGIAALVSRRGPPRLLSTFSHASRRSKTTSGLGMSPAPCAKTSPGAGWNGWSTSTWARIWPRCCPPRAAPGSVRSRICWPINATC